MSEIVVGVDCSTKRLAFVVLFGTTVLEAKALDVKGTLPWQQRVHALADLAREWFKSSAHGGPLVVYVEEPPMGRNYRASLEVGYVVGVVLVEAMRAGHMVVPVNVSTWKKQTVGNGRADKDMVREWATRFVFGPAYAELPKEQDVYDAACIAAFARQNTERGL
jgi:Holliday junction resolvasome RuvABC endonuclease subunit